MIHAKKTMFHVAGSFFWNILIDYLHERKSHKSLISGVAKAQKQKAPWSKRKSFAQKSSHGGKK
jgi:hypothetical protein